MAEQVTVSLTIGEAVVTLPVPATVFKTGSTGFRAVFKVPTSDGQYQCQVQAVKVGSKPTA